MTNEAMERTVTVGEGDPHPSGDADCPRCWTYYPQIHAGCGGLMHAEFGDENADCDYWLYTKCDICGDAE